MKIEVFIDSEFNIEHQDNKSIQDDERKIIIQNDSGTKVEIYWINPVSTKLAIPSSSSSHVMYLIIIFSYDIS